MSRLCGVWRLHSLCLGKQRTAIFHEQIFAYFPLVRADKAISILRRILRRARSIFFLKVFPFFCIPLSLFSRSYSITTILLAPSTHPLLPRPVQEQKAERGLDSFAVA